MKKVITITITIALLCSMVACNKSSGNADDDLLDKTNSLLVDAKKESIDYADIIDELPKFGDTDYEYIVSEPEAESETESEVVSSEKEVESTPTPKENGGGGGNGGGGDSFNPEKYKPVSPLADPNEVDLSTFSVFNGNEVKTFDFNELAGMKIDEFLEETGFAPIEGSVYKGPYSEDYCKESSGYYTAGKGSPIIYVETCIEVNDDNEEEEVVSAILFPEVSSHESESYIKIGGEHGLKLAPDAYNIRLDDAFGENYRRVVLSDDNYTRIYHDEDVFVYFHLDEEACVKEVLYYKRGINNR